MKKVLLLALIAVGIASCVKEERVAPKHKAHYPSFMASIEDQTDSRAYVGKDYKMYWSEEDAIAIVDGLEPKYYEFQGEEGATSGVFSYIGDSITPRQLDKIYALYPTSLVASYGYEVNPTIEQLQQGMLPITLGGSRSSENSIMGGDWVPMAAMATNEDGNNLKFKNLCGFLLLQLYGPEITINSVRISDNNPSPERALCGDFMLKWQAGNEPVLTPMAESSSIMSVWLGGEDITLNNSEVTEILIPIPPTTFPDGFTVEIVGYSDTCGEAIFKKSTNKEIKISRNTITPMAAFTVTELSPAHEMVIEEETYYIEAAANTFTFELNCDFGCEIETEYEFLGNADEWLTFVAQEGNTYTFSATANTTGATRYGWIGIKEINGVATQVVPVTQSGTSAAQFNAFSLVGKWKYTHYEWWELDEGRTEEGEWNPISEGRFEYLNFKADGTGFWSYIEDEEYYEGSHFTYTFNNGVLKIVDTEYEEDRETTLIEITPEGIVEIDSYAGEWNTTTKKCLSYEYEHKTYVKEE